jgi:hypothetical protein
VYVAEGNEWNIRVGAGSVASFVAGPRGPDGRKPPTSAGTNLTEAVARFLATTKTEADRLVEAAANAPPPNDSAEPAQRLKLQVDATLDALIFWLEPAAPPATD